jgi:hypothetical protein
MKFVPRSRQPMHPYAELIITVQESAADLVEHQMTRDRERFQFEKHKLVLLIALILSVWIMFFLLWAKLDDLRPAKDAPFREKHSSPPVSDPAMPDRDQPETTQFHYVI